MAMHFHNRSDKGKIAAKLDEEVFKRVDNAVTQVIFAMAGRKPEKVERVRVAQERFGSGV